MRDPTFPATISALEGVLDRCVASNDRAGYFAAMYLSVTRTVAARAAAGQFQDAARMEQFVARFAGRYLDAYDDWRAARPTTASWDVAFRVSTRWRPIVLQHLLLGMNAHINLDLGVTAAAIGGPQHLNDVRGDFDAINGVLGELVQSCETALGSVSPWIGLADRIGGSSEATMIRFSLRAARAQAWSVAQRISALAEADQAAEIAKVDAEAGRMGRIVAHPGKWAAIVLFVVRIRERATPAAIIAVLRSIQP